jgi:hypothetical protein
MKFKEGDKVVALVSEGILDTFQKGKEYTITEAYTNPDGDECVRIKGTSLGLYARSFEHKDIIESPLYKALA